MLLWFAGIATLMFLLASSLFSVETDPMTMDRQPTDGSTEAYVALQYLTQRQALAERQCNPYCPNGYVNVAGIQPKPGSVSNYDFETISVGGQVFSYAARSEGRPLEDPILSIAQKASASVKSTIGYYDNQTISYKTIVSIGGDQGQSHVMPLSTYENVIGLEAIPNGSVFIGSVRWSDNMNENLSVDPSIP